MRSFIVYAAFLFVYVLRFVLQLFISLNITYARITIYGITTVSIVTLRTKSDVFHNFKNSILTNGDSLRITVDNHVMISILTLRTKSDKHPEVQRQKRRYFNPHSSYEE